MKPLPSLPKRPQVDIGDQTWLVCPVGGWKCARTSLVVGEAWANDAMDVHVQLRHTSWFTTVVSC
jgi:hypothetical protein